ncbi:MAG: HAD family hydrolase [Patescibacteria group bacterium]
MIKAVIFDIDGTLLDSFEANLDFFEKLMKRFGYKPPTREEFPNFFHLPLREAIRAMTQLDSAEKIEKMFNEGQSRNVYYNRNLLKMPEGVEEVISVLYRDYRLGIATSRIKQNVFEAPKLAELKQYFTVVVSYEDTEKHKPEPEPLLLAAERFGVPFENCVYVGDAKTDMESALAANMKFILYGKENLMGADAHINDFRGLPDTIKML